MDDFGDDPDDLAKWGLHCFCLGARSTPHHIVRMDDNGRLLFRARLGVSRTELRERSAGHSDRAVAGMPLAAAIVPEIASGRTACFLPRS
ncbi:hypothetical protein [Amycolatopsis sp. WAC 01376]|uniref:hypothetical protein n=1 Tax=Amycolatopsis sp. WAC 01376 TaxID=2203195 RepID=UPI000F78B207|nr:hypothetical protein [Amycolatopsis sp. WAC 01376]